MEKYRPYEANGGTVIAIAGDDYAVIAADTRLSSGYCISTREQCKLFPVSANTIVGSCGSWNDVIALTSLVKHQMGDYEHDHRKVMSTESLAQMLSVMMYAKRFFPYYVYNIIAGLDKQGKGVVYSYDPIGHYERSQYASSGSSGILLKPVLDSLFGLKNMVVEGEDPTLTKEQAVDIAADAFVTAAERDIFTGDSVVIKTISKDGIEDQKVMLRQD